MRILIVALLTVVVLSLQYHFGLWRNKLLGLIIPAIAAALFVYLSVTEQTGEYVVPGVICVAAIGAIWWLGYRRACRFEESERRRIAKKNQEQG